MSFENLSWLVSDSRARITSDLLSLYPSFVTLYGVRVSDWPAAVTGDLISTLRYRDGTSTRGYAEYLAATRTRTKPGEKNVGTSSSLLDEMVAKGKIDEEARKRAEDAILAWNDQSPTTS